MCRTTRGWTGETQIALITGPNMAGKSTYIRQVALLALLAQTGSFIPAAEARIDLVDRIFTRIGASDDLTRGQTTFMVEMIETANILNNATTRSLIMLDEIGRGTSTFDGLSLAWALSSTCTTQVGAKTLFATHYHELTELAARCRGVKNFNVAVREWHDQIVFLRKICAGRHRQELRHPGGAAGGRAEDCPGASEGDPGQPGGIRTHARGQCAPGGAPAAGPRQTQATGAASTDGFVRVRALTKAAGCAATRYHYSVLSNPHKHTSPVATFLALS